MPVYRLISQTKTLRKYFQTNDIKILTRAKYNELTDAPRNDCHSIEFSNLELMQVWLVLLLSLTSYDYVCHSALLNFHALKTKRRCNMCPISSGVLHISLFKCFFPYALSQVHLLRDQALRLSQYSALPGLSSVSGVSSDNSGHSHGSSGSVAFS